MTFLIVTVAWAAHIRSDIMIISYKTAFQGPLRIRSVFCRLFQVIVRIDDCLALLNLVSKDVGDINLI